MSKKTERDTEPPSHEVLEPTSYRKPIEWAVAKGIVSLTREGNVSIVGALPVLWAIAKATEKWPSASLDPNFTISETAFDAAIERARGF
jgi:hypothetical protein